MKRSEQQEAVVEFARSGRGNLNLVARAGCGKTTTLLSVAEVLAKEVLTGKWDSAFIGAYNKPIADDIKAKLRARGIPWQKVSAGTMHSVGFGAWKKVAPISCEDKNIDEKKVAKIFDAIWPEPVDGASDRDRDYRQFVTQLVSLAKQRAVGVVGSIENRATWFEIVDHFGLDDDIDDVALTSREDSRMTSARGVEMAIRVYKISLDSCRRTIDYDDMILAPLFFKIKLWQHKWVMIDEAQDTNPARRALALKMLAPGGRLIAVGDPAQAIYGFTGADSDSMDLIRESLNSAELPLNVTYRCPKKVVALAQQWVPDIRAADSAPEGIVRTILLHDDESGRPVFEDEALRATDAILCRKTAPLVDVAFSLLKRGVACRVEGKSIGEGIAKLATRFRVKTLSALLTKSEDWKERETQKWLARDRADKAAAIADQVETIHAIANRLLEQGKTTVADLVEFIDEMFKNTKPGEILTLATVHKSKGREWDRVYLLGRNAYMPSRWARKEWQQEQERNLMYVAVTRAMRELVEIWVEESAAPAKRKAA